MSRLAPTLGDADPRTGSRDAALLLVLTLLSVFVLVVIRTAWLSDDAFITLRTVDNLVNGYGPRWNVAERVQAYTHPLWMLVLAAPYAVTREPYFTTLAVSMLCAFGAVWLLAFRLGSSATAVSLGLTVLVFSKAFVEYSTSGLENPLTFLLLTLFLAQYWRASAPGDATGLWLTAALLMLNRLDAGLLVLPALAVRAWRGERRSTARAAAIGLLPLAAWHVFSLVYYGFPFPNTAYAKLQTGIATGELVGQGLLYLLDSLANDPVTLLVTAVVLVAAMASRRGEHWPLALGIAVYLAYIVRMGGDFMTGRFLAAPLLVAVAILVHEPWPGLRRIVPVVAMVVVLLGWQATTRPPITSGPNTYILSAAEGMGDHGIADERAFYYRYTGLLRWSRDRPLPHNDEVIQGRAARGRGEVVVRGSVGMFAYFAGPGVHVVDAYGLGDPFLARLPVEGAWRIGHFSRPPPPGYLETLESGRNQLEEPALAMLYERLAVVTRGPIWSSRRWREILRVNGIW